jgi:hypothetical protein
MVKKIYHAWQKRQKRDRRRIVLENSRKFLYRNMSLKLLRLAPTIATERSKADKNVPAVICHS